jgi:hypothetical protein
MGCFIVGILSDKPCSVNVFNTKANSPLRAASWKSYDPPVVAYLLKFSLNPATLLLCFGAPDGI